MKHTEYLAACRTTWNADGFSDLEQISHAAMGLICEMRELEKSCPKDFAEELGDVCYYASMLSDLIDYDPCPVIATPMHVGLDHVRAANVGVLLLEAIVKWKHHGREMYEYDTAVYLGDIWRLIAKHSKEVLGGLPGIWAANAAKLKARHPHGFEGEGNR